MEHWHNILELLVQTSLSAGADRADAMWIDHRQISLGCRKGLLEGLERSESQAITLRCGVGQAQAIVSSTDSSPESIRNLAAAAVNMAKVAPVDEYARFAPSSLYPKDLPALDLYDAREPDPQQLFTQAQEAEAVALEVAGITNSEGADASYSQHAIGLMIADARRIQFARGYRSSHHSLSVSVLAGEGTDMQRDYDFTSARHATDLKSAARVGHEAAVRAVRRLHPQKIPSATMPVLYDRRVSRNLLSALLSAINGNNILRGSSFLLGALGKSVARSGIHIIDDPLRLRGLASKPFDGEGVATRPLTLVEDGVLASWILDMRTATALGLATTGHASRGMGSPPSPSATNCAMMAGTQSPEALMREMGTGLWITETFGTGMNITTGDYSQGASGFLIENGEITAPVAEITIAGHLRDMFHRMIPANDLVFDYATNAPSLLIEGMSVAGGGS